MKLIPVGHRVLIRPDKVEEVSDGGIVLVREHVEREKAATTKGEVLEVGPDCWYDKPSQWAKAGDRVVYAKYAGFAVDGEPYGYPDEQLRLCNDEDIVAVEAM